MYQALVSISAKYKTSGEVKVSKNVLIVDDERECLEMATISLRLFGDWKVYQAETAVVALERAKELVPDVIVLDYYLKESTGGDIIRSLRSDDALKHIPIVIYSGSPDVARQDPAVTDDIEVLAKPLNPESLCAVLARLCGE